MEYLVCTILLIAGCFADCRVNYLKGSSEWRFHLCLLFVGVKKVISFSVGLIHILQTAEIVVWVTSCVGAVHVSLGKQIWLSKTLNFVKQQLPLRSLVHHCACCVYERSDCKFWQFCLGQNELEQLATHSDSGKGSLRTFLVCASCGILVLCIMQTL